METKSSPDQSDKLSELNKKILEVKKKIQLSEGQRKALFEECEAEIKSNAEGIVKLKKEISEMSLTLHEKKSSLAKHRIKNKELEKIIGPLGEKSSDEVERLLDLQIIDRKKQIDLLKYKTKQRKKYLAELAAKYQKLLNRQEQKELDQKVEKPYKKKTCELQNNIHAVEVKIREAVHVQNKYLNIQKSLKEDSDNFGSNIQKLEEELGAQRVDIQKLQKIVDEAHRMRNTAMHNLLLEEKALNAAVAQREKEAIEGRRLVNERKLELERLERKIFQTGKIPTRPEPEGAEDAIDDKPPTPPHPVEAMAQEFEILKKATGGTNTEEVLTRFESQKDTQGRLNLLRKKAEDEKNLLEKKLENLIAKFESFKYNEFKDAESNRSEMNRVQEEIEKNKERSKVCMEEAQKNEQELNTLLESLQHLHLCINPLAAPEYNCVDTLAQIEVDLADLLKKIRKDEIEENEDKLFNIHADDKWLPGPYSGLLRRTPIPQTGTSPVPPHPPGSEDEEEVPSRGYLKRQAQLVVDAKSRRKNIRIQLPRRN